ncbi:sugar phosphate isomerase/epimerase [Roseibacterium sp. SDUM158017]|uniref:sugar phosphate isomerase/epimerase family protein n=1 Tax=Roseicyclus salinarum TaxID=3036773 RepID=UPI0024158BC7|nr:sugar phosphate isomerase/epimerase family protein [Roseibacterium sp. SDUM158017]MDG4650145.1 sugar phosphate isomerase/epimerase [Roseibacterium sp. SDUM158017]
MTPLRIGAALKIADIPHHRDWLLDGPRDLEIRDFISTEALLGDWRGLAAVAKARLDGFSGRLGIHGPFVNVPMTCNDPELRPIVTRRYLTGLDAAIALGATQMVVHSPFTIWDDRNFGDRPGRGNTPSHRDTIIAACHEVLREVVDRAADNGVTLVIENCDDVSPLDRLELARSFDSRAVKVSLDTGHAHNAHCAHGAVPVDYFVVAAGEWLAHVHLQDTDGYADRHWAPGRGTIRWASVFAALQAAPADPHLVLELRDHGDIPAAMAWLEREGLAR